MYVCKEREFRLEIARITYLERERAKPFIAQSGACLAALTIMSLNRLQLGTCWDTLTTVSMGR